MMLPRWIWQWLLALLASRVAGVGAAKAATPHFKWGQNKELIFISVMVRDLDKDSVSVSLPNGDLRFRAKNTEGEEQALDVHLREDVIEASLRYEIQPRPDKWGTAVVVTLGKQNKHRWDVLVPDPRKFKGIMDKDWSREDQTLEPEEEVPYVEDNSDFLVAVTEKNLNKTLGKYSPVVVNVRYPWCSQCKSQDETFVKAAKAAKKAGGKDGKWKKVAFAVLDAREERRLARQLGAKCDSTCEYKVFTAPGEDPLPLKSQWSETSLMDSVKKFLGPATQVVKADAELEAFKERNTTCLGSFASEASPRYALFKKVAGLLRGELVFAASFGEDRTLELWPHKQNFSFKFDGTWEDNGTALYDWIRPRAIPLLQEYEWQLREPYEKLGLPLAKVWVDDSDKNPSFEKIVRHAVRRVAKKYIGKLAFVEQKKSTYSYELRDFGLNQPEVYPCFGIASNASYNAVKYGFEVTPDIAPSAQEFWKDADKVAERLSAFCDQVLAGTWPEAHESGAPQKDWTAGTVKRIVWKTFKEIESPEKPLLLEIYGKYRQENDRRVAEVANLAKALEPLDSLLTVASYDTSENFLPSEEFKRDKYSSDTEWWWVPARPAGADARPPAKKLTKPKKDAPIKTVIEFAGKQAGSAFKADEVLQRFEELMKENPPPKPAPMEDGPPPGMGMDGMDGMDGMGDLGDMADMDKLSAGLGGKEEL